MFPWSSWPFLGVLFACRVLLQQWDPWLVFLNEGVRVRCSVVESKLKMHAMVRCVHSWKGSGVFLFFAPAGERVLDEHTASMREVQPGAQGVVQGRIGGSDACGETLVRVSIFSLLLLCIHPSTLLHNAQIINNDLQAPYCRMHT